MSPTRPWPLELKLAKGGRVLRITFDDGQSFDLSAECLRVMTGSAQDRGHGSGPRPPIPGKADVSILRIAPVGAYAVRLTFDDGHDTGLYSWDLLYDLGARQAEHWAAYLEELKAAGMARTSQARA
ncbi:MAG TPA: DUF971 domain-containing protein [Caulobacteraceae bacterium]|nr:DUF971 domain-containing protein [Caulobacteraceae bacterium]